MTKKSVKFLALMVALLLALSGCSMITVIPEKDAAEAVVKVNDVVITKGELQTDFNINVAYTVMMYSNFGMSITVDAAADSVRDSYIASVVEKEVQKEKARELGMDQFTAEEEEEFQAYFEEEWNLLVESYMFYADVTDEMTEEEKYAAAVKVVEGYGITRESYEQNLRDNTIMERMRAYAVEGVTLDESQIVAVYDQLLSAQQASYLENPAQFEQDVMNGETIVWMPEGYRTVMHVLLGYEGDLATEMTELQIELDEIETKLAEAEANGGELVSENGETVESLNARKVEIEARMQEVEDQFLAENQATVDEITSRLAAGEDIHVLVAEYGDDTGMMEGGLGYENGYYVSAASTTWDPNFTAGAMALEKVGELSEPVFTFNGLHLIYYMSDVVSGSVPMENVRAELEADLMIEAENVAYAEKLAQWQAECEIKTWPERLQYTGE